MSGARSGKGENHIVGVNYAIYFIIVFLISIFEDFIVGNFILGSSSCLYCPSCFALACILLDDFICSSLCMCACCGGLVCSHCIFMKDLRWKWRNYLDYIPKILMYSEELSRFLKIFYRSHNFKLMLVCSCPLMY